jgi:hypothetical protein
MATDKSEPRIGLIFRIGVISCVVLATVRFALATYFDEVTQGEVHRKVVDAKPEALLSLRSDEQKRLTEGPLPIAQAMQELVAKGRASASPEIAPAESKDVAPLQGWIRMPAEVPLPMAIGAAPSASPSGAASALAPAAPPSANPGAPKQP